MLTLHRLPTARGLRPLALRLLLWGLLLSVALPAQAVDARITPGSVQDTLESPRLTPPSTPAQVVMPVQPQPSPHDPRARRFKVHAFNMSGNTVFSASTLKRVLERFLDMELNLYDLNVAAETITAFYQERGYPLARAVIPPQRVVDGAVTVRIVEGRIGKVTVSGNRRHGTQFMTARTASLAPGTLVTGNTLERSMLLLNDIPGLSARVVLQPGEDFGTTDAEIRVNEKLVSGNFTLTNHGRKETGLYKAEAALNVNSPLGLGDQFAFSGSSTQNQLVRYWKLGYSAPLNANGTRITIGASRAEYEVSGVLAALGVTGEVRSANLSISHPWERTRRTSQWFNVDIKRSRLTQNALGVPISDHAINVLTLSYLVNHIHADTSTTTASLSLATNLKHPKTPAQQDALFARMEADVTHITPFIKEWDLYLRGNMVYSREMLPDTEKFSLGGPASVRAFRPSEVRGDSGYVGTAELRHPFALAGRMGIFRLTADLGEVVYKAPGFRNTSDQLRSVGFGASFYPFSGTSLSFDYAHEIGSSDASNDGKRSRFWVNFSAYF